MRSLEDAENLAVGIVAVENFVFHFQFISGIARSIGDLYLVGPFFVFDRLVPQIDPVPGKFILIHLYIEPIVDRRRIFFHPRSDIPLIRRPEHIWRDFESFTVSPLQLYLATFVGNQLGADSRALSAGKIPHLRKG